MADEAEWRPVEAEDAKTWRDARCGLGWWWRHEGVSG